MESQKSIKCSKTAQSQMFKPRFCQNFQFSTQTYIHWQDDKVVESPFSQNISFVICSSLYANHVRYCIIRVWKHSEDNYQLCNEKTCLRGFLTMSNRDRTVQPYRRWLEAWNFGFKKYSDCTIYVVKTKALISCAVTAQLISAFVQVFSWCGSYKGFPDISLD